MSATHVMPAIDIAAASLIDAHNRRFALAQQVGRLTMTIKLAVRCLDDARDPASIEAKRVPQLALETEIGR